MGNGKGVYCWALAFVLFAVLRAVSGAAAAAKICCCCCLFVLLVVVVVVAALFWVLV